MRHLDKLPEPVVLQQKKDAWRDAYLTAFVNGSKTLPEHWGEVKPELSLETEGLCCYCEERILPASYAQVEHLKPKSIFPWLAHEWSNLGLVCQLCNTEKGAYYNKPLHLIDPYQEDPADHLVWFGPAVFQVEDSLRGMATIFELKLNSRPSLLEDRFRRLQDIDHQYQAWLGDTGAAKVLRAKLLVEDAVTGTYRACVQAFLSDRGFTSGT